MRVLDAQVLPRSTSTSCCLWLVLRSLARSLACLVFFSPIVYLSLSRFTGSLDPSLT